MSEDKILNIANLFLTLIVLVMLHEWLVGGMV